MAMLAWLMALADGFVSVGQKEGLNELCDRLELDEEQREHARFWAQSFVLEEVMRTLYDEGEYTPASREEAYNFASQIGMTPTETMASEARLLKRLSLLAS